MEPNTSKEVFDKFVPLAAAEYCDEIYRYFGFEFQVKKSRTTKFGDYRFDPSKGKHVITINNDLNPFHFLITYLHEVAHLITYKEHGSAVTPHGQEWKSNFKRTLRPVLNEQNFPQDVLIALKKHLNQPKATSCSDPLLYGVLKNYDKEEGKILLKDLRPQDRFTFNGKTYRKISKRRTRSVCEEISSKRKYLIPEIASVSKL